MDSSLPGPEIEFLRAAVRGHYLNPEQARRALRMRQRYLDSGAEAPSTARVLLQTGALTAAQVEALYRHVLKGEALPSPETPGGAIGSPRPPVLLAAEPETRPAHVPPPGARPDPPVALAPAAPPKEPAVALPPGVAPDLIRGYRILEVVGRGATGVIYRALQTSMDRVVALKVVHEAMAGDASFVERFLTEARNAGRLNHPNLVRVHEVSRYQNLYYYSMEFVKGRTLSEAMCDHPGRRMEARRAAQLFVQAASALDHGLRQEIIHRELRPNRILVLEGDHVKIADLGLVRDEQARFLVGQNAHFVAPEQVAGAPVDARTDLYSLGACLYYALCGAPPFEGRTPQEVLEQHRTAPPPDPRARNPAVPEPLAQTVKRLLARLPAERYQTPAEVVEALRRISFGAALTADGAGAA